MSGTSTAARRMAGVIGYFDDSHQLIEAMKKVRDANWESFDAYTPFPVHGLEGAQGLKRSPLPFVTFTAGLTGFLCAFTLQYWTSAVDWPLVVGGKPMNSWPAFVPIFFELTVLFAGLCTAGGMFLLNGLPNVKRRVFDPRLTRDRFAIVIEETAREGEESGSKKETGKKKFSESEANDFLKRLGAKDVKTVYSEGWF